MNFRFSDTVAINYEVRGRGEVSVVFVHGFAASLGTWHDIAPLFPAGRYTLYLLDLKGFGGSSKPRGERYGPEEQAAVVTAFLEHANVMGVVLVGHSLGAGIALLSCLGPAATRISRLVLINPAAYPQRLPPVMRLLGKPLVGRAILHLLPLRFMVRYTLARLLHDRRSLTKERIGRYIACFGGKGVADVFVQTCRQLAPERYAGKTPLYGSLRLPTLIIWGREDQLLDIRQGIRLHGEIVGSRLVVIPGCGHIPQEECPEATYAAINGFLKPEREITQHEAG